MRNSHVIRSTFWTFFTASVLSTVIGNLNAVFSGMVVGHAIGPDAVSVVNLAVPILNFVMIPPLFFVLGANLLASKAVGERKYDDVRRLFTSTLVVSTGIALVLVLASFAFSGRIARLLTSDERLLPLLTSYLGPVSFSCVPLVSYVAFSTLAKAIGRPRLVIRSAAISLTVDLACTVLFVVGFGMGMKGVALAMFLGALAAVSSLTTLFRTDSRTIGFVRLSGGWFGRTALGSLRVGIPLQIGTLVLAIVILVLNGLAQKVGGADGVFVVSIGLQMMSLGMLVFGGASSAVINIGGALWGERDTAGYRLLIRDVLRIIVGTQVVVTVLLSIVPGCVASVFGADAALAAKAAGPLREICLMLLPMSVLMLIPGVFTLEGHALAATVLQLALFVFLLVPACLAASFLPSAFWISVPAGLGLLLALTTAWSFAVSRRDGNLHWLTLAPKSEKFPEFGISVRPSKESFSAALSELDGYIAARSVPEPARAVVRGGAERILGRIPTEGPKGFAKSWCDIRAVNRDEGGGREVQVVIKFTGRRCDPTAGAGLQPASVKYDYLNGVNCVYLTVAAG